MKAIPIFTSIPPRFMRMVDGVDVGAEYLERCILSWRRSNFEPFSVNSRAEGWNELADRLGVARLEVDRDARELCGKPLVYLTDLLGKAASMADGPLAIVNADILLEIPDETRRRVAELEPDECLIARRTDIEGMDDRGGEAYVHGFDFLAFHAQALRGFPDCPFVFGAPWWDYFVPITMFLRGVKQVGPGTGFAYHLLHTERWDWDVWRNLGLEYVSLVRGQKGGRTAGLAREVRRAFWGGDLPLLSKAWIRVRRLSATRRVQEDSAALARVSRVNSKWINERILCP